MTLSASASLSLVALIIGAAPARPMEAQTSRPDRAAILDAARQFSAAYTRGDAAAMTALYTADAVIFPERSDAITGHEAIKRYWTRGERSRVTRHQLTPTRVTVDGKHAYDYGTYEIAGERDGKAWGPFRGKYVVVWRREPDGWRMQLDMWNSGPQPGS
jgi:ketosteroid isomerase-like protein